MSKKIYIVREYNSYVDEPLDLPTSVWACLGSNRGYETHGIKLVGPLSHEAAEETIKGLRTFLEKLGHEVVVETGADD